MLSAGAYELVPVHEQGGVVDAPWGHARHPLGDRHHEQPRPPGRGDRVEHEQARGPQHACGLCDDGVRVMDVLEDLARRDDIGAALAQRHLRHVGPYDAHPTVGGEPQRARRQVDADVPIAEALRVRCHQAAAAGQVYEQRTGARCRRDEPGAGRRDPGQHRERPAEAPTTRRRGRRTAPGRCGVARLWPRPGACHRSRVHDRRNSRECQTPHVRAATAHRRLLAGLVLGCHPGPTLTVTAAVTALAWSAGQRPPRLLWVLLAVLAGQLAVGWCNDARDGERDRRAGRTEKPVVRGWISPVALATAAALAATSAVPLSYLAGGPLGGSAHLVAVASALAYDLWLKATPLSLLPWSCRRADPRLRHVRGLELAVPPARWSSWCAPCSAPAPTWPTLPRHRQRPPRRRRRTAGVLGRHGPRGLRSSRCWRPWRCC